MTVLTRVSAVLARWQYWQDGSIGNIGSIGKSPTQVWAYDNSMQQYNKTNCYLYNDHLVISKTDMFFHSSFMIMC